MHSKFERGAISLVWVAIVSASMAALAMATLYSLRHERNVFAEAWTKLVGQAQKTQQQAMQSATGNATSGIYQCNVNGKVLYSNVACDVKSASSKKVDIQDTRGFEAPKVPVEASATENGAPTLQDKMLEKAMQRY